MLVAIQGLDQGTIDVNLDVLPREGEYLKIVYGADAEVEGEVASINHYINQHADEHKITIVLKPIN
ncbi:MULTISPECIES: hypothetical protein [Acinetobacter]|uniref:Uncharacterized protein n=1 Tax=Acinetobacter piscicola TaxID=2006115 RepID=A0A4Q4H3T3_9GAMM|nr:MULTISPECIES: hypothetical protein [Acinetobacter]MDM1756974.1 hypothetical protein [Acinetobacter sp. 256-1]MDM1759813.1 hypothetical protein [Acinetobacter sp. 251-1]QOW47190.1 hypothetical protein G0028_15605 [Acinetobacter piscicola]RYL29240.1 hypothetical protein EWP19_00145 [Acinetobacter piscicola]